MKLFELFLRVVFWLFLTVLEGVETLYFRARDFAQRNFGRVVFGAMVLGALFALTCCGTVPLMGARPDYNAIRPFVTTYPASLAEDPRDPYSKMYFSRPRQVTLSADLHNPGDHDAIATVYCRGNIFDGHSTRNIFVKARGERFFLVEVMSYDMHEACEVDAYHYVGLPGPPADL